MGARLQRAFARAANLTSVVAAVFDRDISRALIFVGQLRR